MQTNLKTARKDAGFTQTQVAELTGIALGTLRRWEQDVNEPDIDSIIMLASLYNVTTDDLLGSTFMENKPKSANAPQFSSCVKAPIYKVRTGKSLATISPSEATFPVPIEMYRKHPKGMFVEVDSESINEKIPRGCLAFVDPEMKDCVDMNFYAILFQDEGLVFSRLHTLENGVELIPASTDPTFEPKLYDYSKPGVQPIDVVGEIVWHVIPFNWEY